MRDLRLGAGCVGLAALLMGAPAAATEITKPDNYPDRLMTIVVPFGAGGGADQVSRAWGAAMEPVTDVPFQVVNVPGGGGLAAIPDYLARPQDGYTILEADDGLPTAAALGQLDFEIADKLTPICIVQVAFSQIYIRPDDPRYSDWQSFVDYAKQHPGKLTMANSDIEDGLEVIQETLIEEAAGFKTTPVRYDESTARYAALMGGHVDALIEQPGDVGQFVKAGRMKPILTILPHRPEPLADTPSLSDVGMGDIPTLKRPRMFWVHKETPEERKEYLSKACERAFQSDEFQEFNARKFMNLDRSYYSGDEALDLVMQIKDVFADYFKSVGRIEE